MAPLVNKKSTFLAGNMIGAAIQLKIQLGLVSENLRDALEIVDAAILQNAEVIVLPEFFTSGIAINECMFEVPRMNRELAVIDTISSVARKAGVKIAGSILVHDGRDCHNRMVLIDGTDNIKFHDKDIPTQFENAYYCDGDRFRTFDGFGLAMCWEMLRGKTIRELDEDAQVILGSTCWWSLPIGSTNEELAIYNQDLNANMPNKFAEISGLPIIHSSTVGKYMTKRSLKNDIEIEREYIGTTKIVDGTGKTLGDLKSKESSGMVICEIVPGKKKMTNEDFWLYDLRQEYMEAWEAENKLGKMRYEENIRRMN